MSCMKTCYSIINPKEGAVLRFVGIESLYGVSIDNYLSIFAIHF